MRTRRRYIGTPSRWRVAALGLGAVSRLSWWDDMWWIYGSRLRARLLVEEVVVGEKA